MKATREKALDAKGKPIRGLYRRGGTWEGCATPKGARTPVWAEGGLGPCAGPDALSTREAIEKLEDHRVKVRKGEHQPRTTPVTLGEVAEEWLDEQARLVEQDELAEGSYAMYRVGVRKHIAKSKLATLKVTAVNGEDLKAWHRGLGLSAHSVRFYWSVLMQVLAYAVRRKYIVVSPVVELDKREKPKKGEPRKRTFSKPEIRTILKTATGATRLAFMLAIFGGFRLSEVLAIRWGDVDFERGVIVLDAQRSRRGERARLKHKPEGHKREVILMDELAFALKRAQAETPWNQPGDAIVSDAGGRALSQSTLGKRAQTVLEGLPDARFHDGRRTFASSLIAAGKDLVFIASMLGDRTETVLESYAWCWDVERHMDAARAQLSAEFGDLFEEAA